MFKTKGISRHETLQLFYYLFPLQQMKRQALQNKRVAVLRVAFRASEVFGTFAQRAPGLHQIVEKTEIELPEVVLFL